MGDLMQGRERPGGAGVLIIDDNERRNRVCYGKAPKRFCADVRMMAAKVPDQKDEYSVRFNR